MPRVAWGSFFAERLLRERDILASLEHPHIARLYDAGMDGFGRPYLAMEFVEGLPIDEYVRRHALTVRERLGLLLQVCDAVAHAHGRACTASSGARRQEHKEQHLRLHQWKLR
jgi:serine/threonine-protein kinase